MTVDVLTRRQLNRATLARQYLLERADVPVLRAVEHLVGLQAQIPHNPYTALWSRLANFEAQELSSLIEHRALVRTVVMRATLHLVTSDDCLVLRPLMQPVLDAELARHRDHAPHLLGVDLTPVLDYASTVVADRPLNGGELRRALQDRFPDHDAPALAYACRNFLPFVQVPPRGLWGRSAEVRVTTADAWLGRPLAADPSIDDIVLRYLGAFGPASTADVAAWSRLTGLREAIDRLRPRLRAFRDERGRELFDLPGAPRPDPDTPAPPHFLPEYDNAVLSHDDRTRVVSQEYRARLSAAPTAAKGALLFDGFVRANWRLDDDRAANTVKLVIDHVDPLNAPEADDVEAEARRLLEFLEPDRKHDVQLVALR